LLQLLLLRERVFYSTLDGSFELNHCLNLRLLLLLVSNDALLKNGFYPLDESINTDDFLAFLLVAKELLFDI
jgi:hypothetical protein